METRQLEYFVAVAESLSFTRAATALFTVQSAVSAGVSTLERELGITLFERSTRQVALTASGEALLPHARAALESVERVRSEAAESGAQIRGKLRVGIFASIEVLDIAGLLGEFHRRHPHVELQLTVSPTGSTGLSEDLRAGRLDLALMGLPAAELDGLNASTLLDTRCVAVLPLDHALATASTLSLAQLSGESFVDTPRGFGNRVVIDREYERQQLRRRVTTEVTDLRSVATFVAAGLGVAILPAGITQPVPGTVHITLEPPAITWTLSIVRRRTEHPSRAVSALLTLLDTWPIGVPAPPGASYL